ncbi:MAG: C-GCAxxG-C-C family protein [Sphaerochaetaceae bacterium]|nr:C-GCAxxG-C-C family protein [Sphaerochaetaceae bacterium]
MDDEPHSLSMVKTLFLRPDNAYGCAETTCLALRRLYGLPGSDDSCAAMVFNGGFAYSGGTCGALTGATIAVGELAGRSLADHALAKRQAREVMIDLRKAFIDEFGSDACKDLCGYDFSLPGGHDAFLSDGRWRTACTRQIEFVVGRLAGLSFPVPTSS